jgi:hypothetical protein
MDKVTALQEKAFNSLTEATHLWFESSGLLTDGAYAQAARSTLKRVMDDLKALLTETARMRSLEVGSLEFEVAYEQAMLDYGLAANALKDARTLMEKAR